MKKLVNIIALMLFITACEQQPTDPVQESAAPAAEQQEQANATQSEPNPAETQWLATNMENARALASIYLGDEAAAELTVDEIEQLLAAWKADKSRTELTVDEVSLALGTAFGEAINTELGTQWRIQDDDLIVVHMTAGVMGPPFGLAAAKVQGEPELTFADALEQTRRQIQAKLVNRAGSGS